MPQYDVSGVIIDICNDAYEPFERMHKFLQIPECEADLKFHFQTKKFIEAPDGNIISDKSVSFKWIKKASDQEGYYIYIKSNGIAGKIMVLFDIKSDWRNVVITWYDYSGDNPQEVLNSQYFIWLYTHIMMGMIFRYSLLQFDGMVIHASTLKWNGKGLMFSAPSGTGKSTHVKLWQKYIPDVTVLNDDTPAIRIINHKPYVYGTPWSGSSFIHCNDSAPLSAIILLEQAQENEMCRLDNQEAIIKLMPRAFFPYFDQNLLLRALSIFESILVSVPVYLLKCRPDREAVELAYQWLK